MTQQPDLVGRGRETALLEGVLAAAAGPERTSAALLVEGPAGIGKSAMLQHAARQWPTGAPLLRTEGVEPEIDVPFAGLHRLLRPVLDHLPAVPAPQAEALGVALGLSGARAAGTPTTARPAERFLVGAGVLSLVAEAAAGHGLLALVDDAHWLDRESAEALTFAARRLVAEGVVVLFAAPDGSDFEAAGIRRLSLAGLPAADAVLLLAARDEHQDGMAAAVRDRLVELSDGNPLALTELAGALSARQRSGSEPLPTELPLGEGIRRAQMARVSALPEGCRRLLLTVAAEPVADLGVLSRAAGHLGLELDDLEPAEQAGLVTIGPEGVRFASALVRSAVYTDAAFLRRRAVHGALAEAFGSSRPDRWAWHRAVIAEQADPVLADELERSAERARARAGYAATASTLERAAELSTDDANRGRRLVAAAAAAWDAGQPPWAGRLIDRAERLPLDVLLRSRCAVLRGLMLTHLDRPAKAVPVLQAAAEAVASTDPEAAAEAVTAAMEAAAIAGDFSHSPRLAELAETLAEGRSSPFTGLLRGLADIVNGDPTAAAVPFRRAMELGRQSTDARRIAWAGTAAVFLGDDRRGLELYSRAITQARADGAIAILPWLLENRAVLELTQSTLGTAAADATESVRLSSELGRPRPPLLAIATLSNVAALRGNADESWSWGEQAIAGAETYGVGLPRGLVIAGRLELALSLGRVEEAATRAHEIAAGGARLLPMVVIATTASRVEAVVRAGEQPESADLAVYQAWVAQAPGPQYAPLLARCQALVAQPAEARELYEEALRLHEASDRGYDLARTRLLYGEFLRRQRRTLEAREQLRPAVQGFDRLGCAAWAERGRAELRAAGESTGAPAADGFADLTPQELQIVRLVGEGLSNRQVAAQLFLSPRTVEYHLYKVYPKLGITSRAEVIKLAGARLAPPVPV